MSGSFFPGFGQFSRPDIGLLSDGFSNLSEIFSSDRRSALRNVQISPEVLDSLYGVSEDISREDLRSSSGLEKLLLPSLDQLSKVFLDRIPTKLYVNKEFYNPQDPLGGVGSSQIKSKNVILFNGSLQCEGILYRSNAIGDSIFSNPVRQTVALSTSRASLFNIERDEEGFYKSAKYPSSIRVRRRSHVNRIILPKTNFLKKSLVHESPTHTLTVPVDNGNTGTSQLVKLLATKNTPLRIYCRFAKGRIRLTFKSPTTKEDRYFYGVQVQPAQQRPNSAPVEFIPVSTNTPEENVNFFDVNIDISASGFQNLYDLYLYLYVKPSQIRGIEFFDIDIREFPDQKDIGLIGFDNLEIFRLSGDSTTILPLWLKTLKNKLTTLDLSTSGDTWRNGRMGWFDIRNSGATPSDITGVSSVQNKVPLYTAVSYLTVPKLGVFLTEDGSDWKDPAFEDYIKNQNDSTRLYRQFTALKSLSLGDRFYGRSPRFDDVFPNLTSLNWAQSSSRNYRYLFGSLPRVKNNLEVMSYNISNSGAVGDIEQIGTSSVHTEQGHISKYRMASFNISGRLGKDNDISGYINDPSQDWSSWRQTAISINFSHTRKAQINLQEGGTWEKLETCNADDSGGVKFSSTIINYNALPLKAPLLKSLPINSSASTGVIASLGGPENTGVLESFSISYCGSLSAVVDNGINFLLPKNFAEERGEGDDHSLKTFGGRAFRDAYVFRRNDLQYLYNLESFTFPESALTGKLPVIPLKKLKETERKEIEIDVNSSNFYDLSTLSINSSSEYFAQDCRKIIAWGVNSQGCGAILPSFEGSSNSGVTSIDISGSLPTLYRSDWAVSERRGSCVLDTDSPTEVSGLTLITRVPDSSSDPEDTVYILSGGSSMKQKVQVYDLIKDSSGTDLATVLSVGDTEVIISNEIDFSGSLFFHRRTVDISNWFGTGFSSLNQFRASNCKLSGAFRIANGFDKVVNTSYSAVDLSNNVISNYSPGTLGKIFRGNLRRITVDLSNNALPVQPIRKIIEEVSSLEASTSFSNCLVRLSGNKLTSTNIYSNYTQSDIFPASVSKGPDAVTSLSRNETFSYYDEVTVTDSSGNSAISYKLSKTSSFRVPGSLIEGKYYKTQKNSTEIQVEDDLGVKFNKLRKIKVDLGFTYVPPNTTPKVIYTEYLDETTRIDSITESGLTKLSQCPSAVGSGDCWENSGGQILKLNT